VPPDRPRTARAEPREIAELRQIKAAQPDLASAADVQIALIELQRRIQGRVPLPRELDQARVKALHRDGHPVLRFADIPLEWTDFRLMFRQVADILQRFETLDPQDHRRILAMTRDGNLLEPIVRAWYASTASPTPGVSDSAASEATQASALSASPPMLGQVLQLAMRPFLARCAEVLLPSVDLKAWNRPYCPLCGGEPELAVITQMADRLLICSRCTGQWKFEPLACPFCSNDDRAQITSFASRDGQYRVYACEVCRRYLKAFDARRSSRPVMLSVDSVATLPLDAAAMQKGYVG
jgi:formate dehydrogenase maturation protein FdhE